MMSLFKRYQNVFIILVVVVAVFAAYSIFFKDDSAVLSTQEVSTEEGVVDQELIALLLELRSIELDPALFDDARFESLEDSGQELVSEPVGRPNPFAPLGL